LACTFGRLTHGEAASNVRGAAGAALIALAAAVLDGNRAFPGCWAVLPVAGTVLLLSAPAAFGAGICSLAAP
jgi:peptidoglycan/LPS O-acetylase OafA/YrhL